MAYSRGYIYSSRPFLPALQAVHINRLQVDNSYQLLTFAYLKCKTKVTTVYIL